MYIYKYIYINFIIGRCECPLKQWLQWTRNSHTQKQHSSKCSNHDCQTPNPNADNAHRYRLHPQTIFEAGGDQLFNSNWLQYWQQHWHNHRKIRNINTLCTLSIEFMPRKSSNEFRWWAFVTARKRSSPYMKPFGRNLWFHYNLIYVLCITDSNEFAYHAVTTAVFSLEFSIFHNAWSVYGRALVYWLKNQSSVHTTQCSQVLKAVI